MQAIRLRECLDSNSPQHITVPDSQEDGYLCEQQADRDQLALMMQMEQTTVIRNLQVPAVEADLMVGSSAGKTNHLKQLSIPESGCGYIINDIAPKLDKLPKTKQQPARSKSKKKSRSDSEKLDTSLPRFKKINSISASISGKLKKPMNLVQRNNQLLLQY